MANDTPKYYYRVAVSDGWLVDNQGRYERDCLIRTCGHNHRSEATAEACREKLLNWSRDRRECSALWYNSSIVRVTADGLHAPPTADDLPGYCLACGRDVPHGVSACICDACNEREIQRHQ